MSIKIEDLDGDTMKKVVEQSIEDAKEHFSLDDKQVEKLRESHIESDILQEKFDELLEHFNSGEQ